MSQSLTETTYSVLVYIWALLGLEGLSLSIVECLIFGSTLSATDPVTIVRALLPLHFIHPSIDAYSFSLPSSTLSKSILSYTALYSEKVYSTMQSPSSCSSESTAILRSTRISTLTVISGLSHNFMAKRSTSFRSSTESGFSCSSSLLPWL